jgi:rhamnogalacturonyl hydrolase YesR
MNLQMKTLKQRRGGFQTISPADWGYHVPGDKGREKIKQVFGHSYEELERRTKNAVYEFVNRLYDEKEGALHHYYRADNQYISEMDSGNYLMAINFLLMNDRYGDSEMLRKAENCFQWAYRNCTETHPMFTWQGGVQDGFKTNELYVKYTGDAFWVCLALYKRTGNEDYMFYAKQFHSFFKQARKAGFKYKYDTNTYQWMDTGFVWRAFGFPVTAYLEFYELTGDEAYLEHAIAWGEHGLTLQREDGGFYLIDGQFWNSDLTAPELRGLVFLYEATKDERFIAAAQRYADWLIDHQREDGAWPIGIDEDGEICAPNVGPGDVPNIAMSLIRLHENTHKQKYLDSAVSAVRYSLVMQAVEDGRYPYYLDDPHVKWGFWSWEPLYDYSLSGDQSVHHIRGILFVADYIGHLLQDS